MHVLVLDTECYVDYFLISMLEVTTGKIRHFELHDDAVLDASLVRTYLKKRTIVTFNGNAYDLPMISAALDGYTNAKLKELSNSIIKSKLPSWTILRSHKFRLITPDHIDLIEVAPGMSSLKIYGGRLNAHRLQDLPLDPEATIPADRRSDIRKYCENDLHLTKLLYQNLEPQIELRSEMSNQYGMDLRSKSDAQIAETIITSELTKLTGEKYTKTVVKEGTTFRYIDPGIVKFESAVLNEMFAKILDEDFPTAANGSILMPKWLRDSRIRVGDCEYQMGIGGLHSCETKQYICADDKHELCDFDVASYYPSIILQQRLAPQSMGAPFLTVYQSIVTRRIAAKRKGDNVTADVLKIAVNGSFGKLGSKYSLLYAPDLLIQTTITGQLCLLMLIERLTAIGARVMSANTDGVVVYYPKTLSSRVTEANWDWMLDTSFELEQTRYRAIASRDVNNYVAIKLDGKTKGKGVFAGNGLAKNPDCQIIPRAVADFLSTGAKISETIRNCTDIMQFVTVRRVQGGAVWRGEYLGKTVRFYHATSGHADECIHYVSNSNRVPNSAGTRPAMDLPEAFPQDVDHLYYIAHAKALLKEVGCAGETN